MYVPWREGAGSVFEMAPRSALKIRLSFLFHIEKAGFATFASFAVIVGGMTTDPSK